MEIIEINKDEEKGILDYIKEIILNRHPIVKDRTNILYGNSETPEMKVIFNFLEIDNKDATSISFMEGTHRFKTSIPERVRINDLVSIQVIYNIIQFLLSDHDIISEVNKYDSITNFNISFDVDGRDENMTGISCGRITLEFEFNRHSKSKELYSLYLKGIITTFYEFLKDTDMMKREFADYCNFLKQEFIKSLSEGEERDFISLFNIGDLYDAICSLSDKRFIELYNQFNAREKKRELVDNKN